MDITRSQLQHRLSRLRANFGGQFGLAARNLNTGEEILLNAKMLAPTASMIKICVLLELFRRRDAGKVKLTQLLTIRSQDKVGGSGLLDCLSNNVKLTAFDVAVLMMSISDNTATNVLIDLCGLANINRACRTAGMKHTRLRRKINFKGKRGIDRPPFAEGAPLDFVHLLARLYQGELLGADSTRRMLDIMRVQKYMGHLNRYLPFNPYPRELQSESEIWVASKTGGVRGVRTEAGLIGVPRVKSRGAPLVYAVCIMTKNCRDDRWNADNEGNVTVARASRWVFDFMAGESGRPPRTSPETRLRRKK